jgi:hypothetical protein
MGHSSKHVQESQCNSKCVAHSTGRSNTNVGGLEKNQIDYYPVASD